MKRRTAFLSTLIVVFALLRGGQVRADDPVARISLLLSIFPAGLIASGNAEMAPQATRLTKSLITAIQVSHYSRVGELLAEGLKTYHSSFLQFILPASEILLESAPPEVLAVNILDPLLTILNYDEVVEIVGLADMSERAKLKQVHVLKAANLLVALANSLHGQGPRPDLKRKSVSVWRLSEKERDRGNLELSEALEKVALALRGSCDFAVGEGA